MERFVAGGSGATGKPWLLFALALASALVAPDASAVVADELERFAKCHQQFTGDVVRPDDARLRQIRAGTMTGNQACAVVLQSANLVGGMLASSGAGREEGKKILATFNSLHNSFFQTVRLKERDHQWIYDYNDRSYYLLNALFSTSGGASNYPFSRIFSDETTWRAVRSSTDPGYRTAYTQTRDFTIYGNIYEAPQCRAADGGWGVCGPFPFVYQTIDPRIFDAAKIDVSTGILVKKADSTYVREDDRILGIGGYLLTGNHNALMVTHPWTWTLEESLPTGPIVGLRPATPKRLPHAFQRSFNSSDGYYRNHLGPAYKQPYLSPVEDVHDNLGTGILFPPSYQENLGLDDEQIGAQNGVDLVPRKWVEELFSDFLCRKIPVIRQADAAPYVQATMNPSAPFRSASSCMRCHATIDPLSFTARNYQYSMTGPFGKRMMVNRFHLPSHPDVLEAPFAADPFFPVRPPRGAFRYRDYAGQLHDLPLVPTRDPTSTLRQLAQVLAGLDDTHACLAGKYFSYLTGIQPVFADPGDPDAPVLSARDQAIRAYVISLGKQLKSGGDLRKVLLEIVSTNLFLDPRATSIK